ncbi:MAG: hypothetical protein ABSF77_20625 [Spirochaetia bacterium]|jgi:hypothetical protein
MSDIVPRQKLTKQGVQGAISIAGGIGAFVLAAITSIPVVGIIVGGIITIAGLALAGSKHERGAGVITTVVGVATLAATVPFINRIFGGLVHGVLIFGGIVLVGVGAYSLFKFFRGLKTRT